MDEISQQVKNIHNLPKINQDEISKLNRSVTPSEIKATIKSLPTTKKGHDQIDSAQNSTRSPKN